MGRMSNEDEPCSGHSSDATGPGIVKKIHKIVLQNYQIMVREIAEALGISPEQIENFYKDFWV